jgi:hypothetical protein
VTRRIYFWFPELDDRSCTVIQRDECPEDLWWDRSGVLAVVAYHPGSIFTMHECLVRWLSISTNDPSSLFSPIVVRSHLNPPRRYRDTIEVWLDGWFSTITGVRYGKSR